jgi:hypothetical protein
MAGRQIGGRAHGELVLAALVDDPIAFRKIEAEEEVDHRLPNIVNHVHIQREQVSYTPCPGIGDTCRVLHDRTCIFLPRSTFRHNHRLEERCLSRLIWT